MKWTVFFQYIQDPFTPLYNFPHEAMGGIEGATPEEAWKNFLAGVVRPERYRQLQTAEPSK